MDYESLIAEINNGNVKAFYHSVQWTKLRKQVLEMDRNECQMCKLVGRYRKATVVHHVNHLKDRPDLCLSVYDETGRRQLLSVCKECHENKCHPDRIWVHQFKATSGMAVTQEERWD